MGGREPWGQTGPPHAGVRPLKVPAMARCGAAGTGPGGGLDRLAARSDGHWTHLRARLCQASLSLSRAPLPGRPSPDPPLSQGWSSSPRLCLGILFLKVPPTPKLSKLQVQLRLESTRWSSRPIQGIMAVVPPAACQKPDPQTAGGCREGAQESIKARWELGWNGVGEGCGGRLVGDQGSSVQEVGMP